MYVTVNKVIDIFKVIRIYFYVLFDIFLFYLVIFILGKCKNNSVWLVWYIIILIDVNF